jgi:predicted membrane GTPase involved in stress response
VTPRLLQRFDTRPSARRALGLMHPECPIEQALRGADDRAQRALQQEIWNAPSFVETDALLVADPKCLRVLARTERALAGPVDALRQRYGSTLVVEPPAVRYAHGAPVLEPYMIVLLCGPEDHLPIVQRDLSKRRSQITRLDHHAGLFVLEAEAPLGNLLGYCDWLHALTAGETDVSMWLSRYLPIDDDGPYAA